ncbi:hypothetical protein [Cohnella cholangitidis]|uniref:Uncharacterized protein n=1 Tax=Cohnella cholangitidis TaxID=2598458 RepID=A0A7G5C0D0_9BACL|nr:hypothetical protein [Cohnella cholangitidis]QMV42664.1 hypothetical protein FPL14_16820 [Cohnella cholangitidis]
MTAIINYITTNSTGIIQDSIFAFIGVFLGILFSPKSDAPHTGNGTSIHQTIQFIQQKVIYNINRSSRHSKPRRSSSNDSDENPLGFYIVGVMLLAFLFYKFHSVIMAYFTGFMLLALASTLTIAIKLYMNNQYDNLNRFWTGVSFFFISIDLVTLILMGKQIDTPISISSMSEFFSSFGMVGVLKYAYFALGFIFILLPNIYLIILLVHMFAVNHYLVRGGRISAFIIRKTSRFTINLHR